MYVKLLLYEHTLEISRLLVERYTVVAYTVNLTRQYSKDSQTLLLVANLYLV